MEQMLLVDDENRTLIFAGERFMIFFEISQSASVVDVKVKEKDLTNPHQTFRATSDKNDIQLWVDAAIKSVILDKTRSVYPMNTPSGGTINFEKVDLEILDLVLKEPDDEVVREVFKSSSHVLEITTEPPKDSTE